MPPKGGNRRKAQTVDATHIPSLGEQLSYLHSPKPFKNPKYVKNTNRRSKTLKAVLALERERDKAERERRRAESMQVDGTIEEEDATLPTYLSIEAPPSLLPQKHYCDITGLEAPYTHKSGLRYHDKSVYAHIQGLTASATHDYLAARGVNSVVK